MSARSIPWATHEPCLLINFRRHDIFVFWPPVQLACRLPFQHLLSIVALFARIFEWKKNVWERTRDEINISTSCSLLGFNMTMWKNNLRKELRDIFFADPVSISVGVILCKGSVEFHTLACHCKHVHIVRSWVRAFGIFLARILSSFVMYRYIFVLLRSSPWKLLWSHLVWKMFR